MPKNVKLWKTGKIVVKFLEIAEGLNVHLMGGTDLENMTESLVKYDQPAVTGKNYVVDQDSTILITIYPNMKNGGQRVGNGFHFEYWADKTT